MEQHSLLTYTELQLICKESKDPEFLFYFMFWNSQLNSQTKNFGFKTFIRWRFVLSTKEVLS